jgi:hypothetical protein
MAIQGLSRKRVYILFVTRENKPHIGSALYSAFEGCSLPMHIKLIQFLREMRMTTTDLIVNVCHGLDGLIVVFRLCTWLCGRAVLAAAVTVVHGNDYLNSGTKLRLVVISSSLALTQMRASASRGAQRSISSLEHSL